MSCRLLASGLQRGLSVRLLQVYYYTSYRALLLSWQYLLVSLSNHLFKCKNLQYTLGDAYNFILDVEGYPSSFIYFLVGVGLLVLRWRAPNLKRPFKVWFPVVIFFLIGQGFLLVAPFLRPPGGIGDTSLPYWLYPVVGILVLALGVLYWFVWRTLLPAIGGFKYVEQKAKLKDDTTVTVFKREKLKP